MTVTDELKFYAQNLSILIVEDDLALNEELTALCSLFFKEVRFAYDGEEALKLYVQKAADIVMSDITMPKMNGIDLSRKIKCLRGDQSIVIVSAHCHLEYITQIIDIGIKQFIRKPFDDEDLLYRLLKVSEDIVLTSAAEEYNSNCAHESENNEETIPLRESEHALVQMQEVTADKLQAHEFLEHFDYDIGQDIDYLLELNENFETYIQLIFLHKANKEYIQNISLILTKMFTTLSQMNAMHTMALVIYDLASFLENIEMDALNATQIEALNILEFIYEDISKFLITVFVHEDANDIHYLENSLKSSILQLEQNIFGTQLTEEDFELF